MRILICGGREFTDFYTLDLTLRNVIKAGDVIIHGGARGADTLAGRWAEQNGYEVVVFKADWLKNGRSAGPIRNQQMLDEGKPDVVIAFPTKDSIGTWDMVRRAKKAGRPTTVVQV